MRRGSPRPRSVFSRRRAGGVPAARRAAERPRQARRRRRRVRRGDEGVQAQGLRGSWRSFRGRGSLRAQRRRARKRHPRPQGREADGSHRDAVGAGAGAVPRRQSTRRRSEGLPEAEREEPRAPRHRVHPRLHVGPRRQGRERRARHVVRDVPRPGRAHPGCRVVGRSVEDGSSRREEGRHRDPVVRGAAREEERGAASARRAHRLGQARHDRGAASAPREAAAAGRHLRGRRRHCRALGRRHLEWSRHQVEPRHRQGQGELLGRRAGLQRPLRSRQAQGGPDGSAVRRRRAGRGRHGGRRLLLHRLVRRPREDRDGPCPCAAGGFPRQKRGYFGRCAILRQE